MGEVGLLWGFKQAKLMRKWTNGEIITVQRYT